MGKIIRECQLIGHIIMRCTSAAALVLLFVNFSIMGEDGILPLEAFAYGFAFGLSWYVPFPTHLTDNTGGSEQ